jgi:hypothetical protein
LVMGRNALSDLRVATVYDYPSDAVAAKREPEMAL